MMKSKALISFFLLSVAFATQASEQHIKGTWQDWIRALKQSGKGGLPGRPDAAELSAPLPTWVDCHLSWYLDQPKSTKNALFSKIVLRSSSKICKGQLEEWAP